MWSEPSLARALCLSHAHRGVEKVDMVGKERAVDDSGGDGGWSTVGF